MNTGIFDFDYYKTDIGKQKSILRKIFHSRLCFYIDYLIYVPREGLKMLHSKNLQDGMVGQAVSLVNLLEKYGANIILEGMNNFPIEKGPYVFACNHMSILDTHILPGVISSRMPVSIVIKDSLLKTPFFGKVLSRHKAIALMRNHPGEDLLRVLNEGTKRLSQGISVMLFPESTRQDVFSARRFNSMAIKLALKAKVSVVPVAIKTDFLRNGKVIKDFGSIRTDNPVRMSLGKPLELTGRGRNEHQAVVNYIRSKLTEWGARVED